MIDIARRVVQQWDDEWHGADCFDVEIDVNVGTWREDGTVSFVLYVKPKEQSGHVTDDKWAQLIIEVPLHVTLDYTPPNYLVGAIRNSGKRD